MTVTNFQSSAAFYAQISTGSIVFPPYIQPNSLRPTFDSFQHQLHVQILGYLHHVSLTTQSAYASQPVACRCQYNSTDINSNLNSCHFNYQSS